MIVKAIECPVCGDKIYSRCEGDSQSCICGFATISGGPEEPAVSPLLQDTPFIDLDVQANPDDLYWDWNLNIGNYGIISEFLEELERSVQFERDPYQAVDGLENSRL